MDCPECGGTTLAFEVPPALREHAPGESAAICRTCLAVSPADGGGDPDFSRIVEDFPDGEAGVAMALATGLIVDSLALNRETITDLFERVQSEGADPWLVLERLAVGGSVDPDTDLEKARRQLDQLLR